jgi:thiol:disulfide interchange protein DsbA
MYRRVIAAAGLLAAMILAAPLHAQEGIEGKYVPIKPAQPTQSGDRIEVVEVFWYGCPHCYSFEPHLEEWLENKPDDVAFIRIPGVLNQGWIPHAKAYYAAEKLGIVDKIHRPLFDAIHRERRQLYTEDQLAEFFAGHGVPAEQFKSVFNSKEVDTKIRQAYFLARDYKLTGVPSLVINGKYLTSGTHAGTFESMLEVTDKLIEQERQ